MKVVKGKIGKGFVGYLTFIIIVTGFTFVYALTAGTPPNPGHGIEQISAPAGCNSGELLQWTGSGWECMSLGTTADYCNSIDTGLSGGVAWMGYMRISLLRNGRNMCEDGAGCVYSILRYDSTYPEGRDYYGTTQYPYFQITDPLDNFNVPPRARGFEGFSNNRVYNGDWADNPISDAWGGCRLYDDMIAYPYDERSRDYFSFYDGSDTRGFRVSVCDN